MSHSKLDLELRQCLHIRIMRDTHAALRVFCFENKLSIQEVIDEMCRFLISGDPDVVRLIEEISDRKRKKIYRQFVETDTQTIFEAINAVSPINSMSKTRDIDK